MMNKIAKTLGAVHTITLQNKNWAKRKNNIGNKAGILQYALLNIHARDG